MEPLRAGDPAWVGAYRLIARLGDGGMGTVFLGRTVGGRAVAVKLVRPEFTEDQQFRRRFRQEVDAARRVGGRWTPPVLGADTGAWRPWVATDYVPGPDLAAAVRQFGAMPEATVRALGAGLAEGLRAVHDAGLVHRDVKPSNVLLSLDGPRLIDFGIARALDADGSPLTRTGAVIGSPGYMSPEQAAGEDAGPAGDVFSLGAVLAYAATGRPPFRENGNAAAVMVRILHDEPDLDGVPDGLRDVVAACLNKDPAKRPTPARIREMLDFGPVATATTATAAATDGRAGWLPPEVSDAVARLATELLQLEAPDTQPPSPPPPPPLPWPTMTATPPRPSSSGYPVPLVAVVTAVVVVALLVWGLVAERIDNERKAFTPSAMNSASSDPAPLTAAAMLPPTFTTPTGSKFVLSASSVEPCLADGMTANVEDELTANGCTKVLAASYVGSGAPAAVSPIVVSVKIFTFGDASAAQQADQGIGHIMQTQTNRWSFGLWCPPSGVGSGLCGGTQPRNWLAYIVQQHRYVVASTALYADGTTPADNWVYMTPGTPSNDCGPAYYVNYVSKQT